ncbi:MAG TPA: PhzF family phenazine biosynthesis protein [Chitinophagaceae bacterium]|nr:PhzF family phenazine biosynthesis protein [Chitinophagaceae bacterium]
MKLTIYQVDAFAGSVFKGNPAAVIPLERWIDEKLMQQIAMENNLAETVFFVPKESGYEIRWFTPEKEINLCGHATLASAYVLLEIKNIKGTGITFHSASGPLQVKKISGAGQTFRAALDFPSWMPERKEQYPDNLKEALGVKEITGVYEHRDLLVELNAEEDVREAAPDFTLIKKTGYKIIITAPGREVDFVSRFFAPTYGVDEDPVTGSAHSQLIPFWSSKLGKNKMEARQLSRRGGHLWVEQKGERVSMAGECAFYMQGEIYL